MAAKPGPMTDPETAAQIAALVKKGALGPASSSPRTAA
jgi:hypothetical protein